MSEIFLPQNITLKLRGDTKIKVIKELVFLLDKNKLVYLSDHVLADIIERENHLSTGLENGIAVPHGKSDGVSGLIGALGISTGGIDFDSLDGGHNELRPYGVGAAAAERELPHHEERAGCGRRSQHIH